MSAEGWINAGLLARPRLESLACSGSSFFHSEPRADRTGGSGERADRALKYMVWVDNWQCLVWYDAGRIAQERFRPKDAPRKVL